MSKDLAIKAEGLGKRYMVGSAQPRHDSIRHLLAAGARSLAKGGGQRRPAATEFWALRDTSFEQGRAK